MSERAMPTMGPVHIRHDTGAGEIATVYAATGGYKTVFGVRDYDGSSRTVQDLEREADANTDLISAAFNAATSAREMGFDPIGAIQQLPALLVALDHLRRTHHVCEDAWYSCPKSEGGCTNEDQSGCLCGADEDNDLIGSVLSAARTREVPE